MELKYTKIRNVKDPIRAHDTDAGIDFFTPNDIDPIKLYMGSTAIISLGIKVHIPKGFMLMFGNKGGVSLKKGLIYGGGISDSGYTGELILQLFKVGIGTEDKCITSEFSHGDKVKVLNGSSCTYTTIYPGEKIIQGILIPIDTRNPQQISNDEYLLLVNSERGEGRHGSTGIK